MSARSSVLVSSGGRCYVCGIPLGDDWHLSHVVAKACGGSSDSSNLKACCSSCNLSCRTCDLDVYKSEFLSTRTQTKRRWSKALNAEVRSAVAPEITKEITKERRFRYRK